MISTRERIILGALMAVSNMGHTIDEDMVLEAIDCYSPRRGPEDLVLTIAQPWIEDDNSEDAFMQEAESWGRTLEGNSWLTIEVTWPDHKWWFDLVRD